MAGRFAHRRSGELVVIDNRDSFTFNLVHRVYEIAPEVSVAVVRNDAISVAELASWTPAALLLSPGPGHPDDAGICGDAIRTLALGAGLPTLGICLGHQAIVTELGGVVVESGAPRHGKASEIEHSGTGLLANIGSPLAAGRYHSLVAEEPLPEELVVDARHDGYVMAFHHTTLPLFGVQFHPESILTPCGRNVLQNFLVRAALMPG